MTGSRYVPAEFVGQSQDTLRLWLTQVQQAIQDLSAGGKVETASYTQGDGAKSVTYTRAQLPMLEQRAAALAAALNLGRGYNRRPTRFIFR